MRHYKLWIFLVTNASVDRVVRILFNEGFGIEAMADSKKICDEVVFAVYLTSRDTTLPTSAQKGQFRDKLKAALLEAQVPYSGYVIEICENNGSTWGGGNLDTLKFPNDKDYQGPYRTPS